MAGEDESLLDVFVNIAAKGLNETEKDIDDFVGRVHKAFGDTKSFNVGTGIADGVKKNLRQAVDAVKEQAEKIKQSLRESLLRFGQEKDLLSIQVRLLGDDDIKRRLQDIQSQVSAATKTFNLAEPGETGDSQRASAIAQIDALRQQELATLRQITDEQVKQRGLDSVYEKQAASFLQATQNAQTFNQQLKELNRLVSSTRDVPLISEFTRLKTEIERAQLALRQGLASGNLVDVDDATAQLNTLRLQFDRFRDDAQKAIVIRTNAQDITANFNAMIARIRRDEARDSSLTRGSAITGNQRAALAQLKHEVSEVAFEFRTLSSQTDLTARDIQELTVLFNRLQQAGQNIGDIRDQITSAVQPVGILSNRVNTLSNNAYQMGQAFEDAAVGFSLNGIAGAVRGASNNITFLIQNITQARLAQAQLTGQTVSPLLAALPLYASIGAAISLVVVGPMIDWIESLNDVEVKLRGLSDLIKRSFADARFAVSLELDAESSVKAIREAKDARDAIEEVISQAEASEKLRFKITSELDIVSNREVFTEMERAFKPLEEAVEARLKFIREAPLNPFAGFIVEPEEIQAVKNIGSAIDTLRIAQEQMFKTAGKGIVPVGELETVRDSLRLINDEYELLLKSGVLSEESAEELKKVIEEIQSPIGDLTEEALKFQAVQEAILGDGLKALGLFKGLSAEYQFLDAVNDGRLEKEDKILFDMQQQNVAIDEQAKKLREMFGNNNPQVEAAIENQRGNLREEQRIDLTAEILDLEKKIAEERESAAKDAEGAEKRRLDIQERIFKEQKDAIKDAERAEKNRLKIEERISDATEKAAERAAENEQALNDAKNARDLSQMEKSLQKRIELLQKADVQSRNFQLGDVGTIAFRNDTKTEVERLQQQLKDLRESANEASNDRRMQELQDKIVSDREDSQEKIQDLREDLQNALKEKNDAVIENQQQMEDLRADLAKARQDEIDAINKNADEINKLNEQLRLLNGALQQNQNRGILGIPQLDANGNRNGPMFLPEDDAKAVGEAQAQANAAAMQNVDFKSSSIETLIGQSNRLLATMSTALQNQDLQPRLV